MHFIDFLLHLLCFVCWTLKKLYMFSFDYVIPVTGYVLPILIKYLSQLFTLVLRTFFTYVAPCIIQIVNGTTLVFTHILNGFNFIFMAIIESELNLEYAHAVAMICILVAIIYFHVTQRMVSFGRGIFFMLKLYARFVVNVTKILLFIVKFVYVKTSMLLSRRKSDERKGSVPKLEKSNRKHSTNGTIHQKTNRKHSINGTTHQRCKDNNNCTLWSSRN